MWDQTCVSDIHIQIWIVKNIHGIRLCCYPWLFVAVCFSVRGLLEVVFYFHFKLCKRYYIGSSVYANLVMTSVVLTLLCGLALSWRTNTSGNTVTRTWRRRAFGLHTISVEPSGFIVVHQGKKFKRILPFPYQKPVAMIFYTDGALLHSIFLGDIVTPFNRLSLGFGFRMAFPDFIPLNNWSHKALLPVSSSYKKSVVLALLACLREPVRSFATNGARTVQ